MTRLGVISDTHGLLRPEAIRALAGSDRILHAGDVGRPEILAGLRRLAPVTAVRGNIDLGAWADALPVATTVVVEGARVHLQHIREEVDLADGRVQVLVTGHTHRPAIAREGEVLHVNPGSAGPRRFRLPVTVALLEVDGEHVTARLVHLEDPVADAAG